MVFAAEDDVDAGLGREEVAPPGEVEILVALCGEDAHVHEVGSCESHGDELREEWREAWAAFEDVAVGGVTSVIILVRKALILSWTARLPAMAAAGVMAAMIALAAVAVPHHLPA